MRSVVSLLVTVFAAAACAGAAPEAGPTCEAGNPHQDRRGGDCLCCHQGEFGVAGSAGSDVTEVHVVDARGVELVMSPDANGNFFRHYQPTPPLRASIVRADGTIHTMNADATGSCNHCHGTSRTAAPL